MFDPFSILCVDFVGSVLADYGRELGDHFLLLSSLADFVASVVGGLRQDIESTCKNTFLFKPSGLCCIGFGGRMTESEVNMHTHKFFLSLAEFVALVLVD